MAKKRNLLGEERKKIDILIRRVTSPKYLWGKHTKLKAYMGVSSTALIQKFTCTKFTFFCSLFNFCSCKQYKAIYNYDKCPKILAGSGLHWGFLIFKLFPNSCIFLKLVKCAMGLPSFCLFFRSSSAKTVISQTLSYTFCIVLTSNGEIFFATWREQNLWIYHIYTGGYIGHWKWTIYLFKVHMTRHKCSFIFLTESAIVSTF